MKRITILVILISCISLIVSAQTNGEIKEIYELNDSFTNDRYFYSLNNEKQIFLFACKDWNISIWLKEEKLEGNIVFYKEHDYWSFESENNYHFEFQYSSNSVDFTSLNELPINTTLVEVGILTNGELLKKTWLNRDENGNLSLSKRNAMTLNDKAYYLSEIGCFGEAIMILKIVLEYFPTRIVAYINLGDAYWGLEEKDNASQAYQKYIELMKASGKECKIPQRVYERIKE
ncbi:hypothetical protein BZG02_15925 [Labilibaculum filiforme]|uniref:Uncharacterized protein n=1 Tax=Labilibaculum filiforme TaxID=1940526 RepID=A0A2N3HTQ0_9BACT|nr:tetratricopeptide repeat protein [Labilibaculum filiforme]PKQ61440.1 hypothetical protein BZG02_15925 [Labilibaculum filiforme]